MSLKPSARVRKGDNVPVDSRRTRTKFKQISGVDKFLERQYKAHCQQQERKLMQHNMSAIFQKQKTLADLVNTSFAYQDVEPRFDVPRLSILNKSFDGTKARRKATKRKANVDLEGVKRAVKQLIHCGALD